MHGAAIPTPGNVVLAAGDTVLVVRAREQGAHWCLLTGDRLAPVPELDGVFGPKTSPTGELVAWTSYPDARTTRVTAWDPQSRPEIDLDAAYSECCGGGQQVELVGIGVDDTVFSLDARHSPDVDAWVPGEGAPERRPGPPDDSGFGPSTPLAPFEDAVPEGTRLNGIAVESEGSVLVRRVHRSAPSLRAWVLHG